MTNLDVDPELRDLYPKRTDEIARDTRRKLTELEGAQNRVRDHRKRAIFEAIVLFAITDIVLIGIGWKLILADIVVGSAVGFAWDRFRTGPGVSGLLGVVGYLATLFVFGVPTGEAAIYYLVAAGLVGVLSRHMATQRMESRMGV